MKILFKDLENKEGIIYVSLDDGINYTQYELKNVWSTGIEIPDDVDFSKVRIKARAEIFKNSFVISSIKTLTDYKIDFDIEKEMISYYKKTEVDDKLLTKVDLLSLDSNASIAADSYNAVLIIATSDLTITYPDMSGTDIDKTLTAGGMTILAKSGSGYTNSIFGAVFN